MREVASFAKSARTMAARRKKRIPEPDNQWRCLAMASIVERLIGMHRMGWDAKQCVAVLSTTYVALFRAPSAFMACLRPCIFFPLPPQKPHLIGRSSAVFF